MISRVARAYGQLPRVVARERFADVVWAAMQLTELERFDALRRDGEGLQAATRTAIAFHEPKRLEEQRREFLARLNPKKVLSAKEARARALKLIRSGAMADVTNPEVP